MDYKHSYIKYKSKYFSLKNQSGSGNDKEIYLIRHGETEWNKLKKGQGQEADIPLNDTGREQVKKTALYLKKYRMDSGPFDCISASPMLRTKESAEIIKDIVGIKFPIQYDDILKERKHGKLSGLGRDDPLMTKVREFEKSKMPEDPIEKMIGFEKILEEENKLFDIGWETNAMVEKRIEPFIDKLIKNSCKKIIVMAHGGVLLSMIRKILKTTKPPEGNFDNGDNCWIAYLTYNDMDEFRLLSPPNTAHLGLIK